MRLRGGNSSDVQDQLHHVQRLGWRWSKLNLGVVDLERITEYVIYNIYTYIYIFTLNVENLYRIGFYLIFLRRPIADLRDLLRKHGET